MSPRLRIFLWLLHRNTDPFPPYDLSQYRCQINKTWLHNRWWIDGRLVKIAAVHNEWVQNRHGQLIQVRRYVADQSNGKVLFYLHGGGWVGRNILTYDNFCRRVCHNTGVTVFSIGYRLSPEVKYPGAIEDGVDIIRYLVSNHNFDADNLYFSGDSAGGNMAIGITWMLRKEIQFRKLLLLYPPVSAYLDQPSMDTFGKGYIIERKEIAWMRDQYLNTREQFTDQLVSPIFHKDFDFMPETMITIGGKDPLVDQVVAFSEKVQSSSNRSIRLIQYPELPHGFYLLHNLSGEVKRAYREVYKYLSTG